MVLTPETAPPRCTCTVDLISRVFRPYLFKVIVTGEPPHAHRVEYKISAPDENSAAMKGMQLFVREFLPYLVRQQLADLAPRARLQ
jgi:hypothetical protein